MSKKEGEFKKRIHKELTWLEEQEVLKIVDEAKKEMPTLEETQMALSQLLNFFPQSQTRDHIQSFLEKQYKATWKWFGEKE